LVLHLIVKFNHTADSIALIVVDTILCGIGFVCFNEFIQASTLELNDKAQVVSYEHYYPYGGTALIAGKDKTEVQQKRP
jgi:hypothetical protein